VKNVITKSANIFKGGDECEHSNKEHQQCTCPVIVAQMIGERSRDECQSSEHGNEHDVQNTK